MSTLTALVQPLSGPPVSTKERRAETRHTFQGEGIIRQADSHETLSWGATVSDISVGGLGLTLCYPFKPGTFLTVDLENVAGYSQTLVAKVVHVRDKGDGSWHIGCQFLRKLTPAEIALWT